MYRILNELKQQGYSIAGDLKEYYKNISLWNDWWKGYVDDFHQYKTIGIDKKTVSVKRHQLGMAKKVAEDWADLLLNDKTMIKISDEASQKYLTGDETEQMTGVLGNNSFWLNSNRLIEKAYAKGTGAFILGVKNAELLSEEVKYLGEENASIKTWINGGELDIRYIKDAEKIIPLSWENEEITECAFVSFLQKNKKKYAYVEKHLLSETSGYMYTVVNEYYELTDGGIRKAELPSNMLESINYRQKMFFIVAPNIENNMLDDIPMGISIYANATSQLQGCDLTFDNFLNDFTYGKKKVFVDENMVATKDGKPVVGKTIEQSLYVQLGNDRPPNPNGKNPMVEEYNPTLRVTENKDGLQLALNMLSAKCRLGNRRYSFDDINMTTATQVRTSNKDLTESVWKQRVLLQDVLIKMTQSILLLAKEYFNEPVNPDAKIAIEFDDTMFTDEAVERMQDLTEVREGIMGKVEYRIKWYNEDEETAKKAIDEQNQKPNDWFTNNTNSKGGND